MMALTGHVATTVLPVGADTHTVENSDGELACDALLDGERVALPEIGTKPVVLDAERDAERDAETLNDAGLDLLAERDAERDADADTLRPRVGDRDRVGDGDTSVHCA